MAYYLDLFSPETYEAFGRSRRSISGFRPRQLHAAQRIKAGDHLLCYMTRLSRWVGILEVVGPCFRDDAPVFYPTDDPFTVRFKVKSLAWLSKEHAIPIREREIWNHLSFTRGHDKGASSWTGKLRCSLVQLDEEDGAFLERRILDQLANPKTYKVDQKEYERLVTQRIRRLDKEVTVTVPESDTDTDEAGTQTATPSPRESVKMQGLLAKIAEKMGLKVWLPRNDRGRVSDEWTPEPGVLLDALPLSYDETTIRTIENIDVLWLKGRSILRAFEVEHTTAVYSGLLRMADLMALQPNMDIRLHIVAPIDRREKVFQEIRRPVFTLLERAPLAELCTFLSYESVEEVSRLPHLAHLSDSVIDEYEEDPE